MRGHRLAGDFQHWRRSIGSNTVVLSVLQQDWRRVRYGCCGHISHHTDVLAASPARPQLQRVLLCRKKLQEEFLLTRACPSACRASYWRRTRSPKPAGAAGSSRSRCCSSSCIRPTSCLSPPTGWRTTSRACSRAARSAGTSTPPSDCAARHAFMCCNTCVWRCLPLPPPSPLCAHPPLPAELFSRAFSSPPARPRASARRAARCLWSASGRRQRAVASSASQVPSKRRRRRCRC